MTTGSYEAYVNYGDMPLHEQIMKIWPWVDGRTAQRLADECRALPEPPPGSRKSEKAYRYAQHIHAEARKLKRD